MWSVIPLNKQFFQRLNLLAQFSFSLQLNHGCFGSIFSRIPFSTRVTTTTRECNLWCPSDHAMLTYTLSRDGDSDLVSFMQVVKALRFGWSSWLDKRLTLRFMPSSWYIQQKRIPSFSSIQPRNRPLGCNDFPYEMREKRPFLTQGQAETSSKYVNNSEATSENVLLEICLDSRYLENELGGVLTQDRSIKVVKWTWIKKS